MCGSAGVRRKSDIRQPVWPIGAWALRNWNWPKAENGNGAGCAESLISHAIQNTKSRKRHGGPVRNLWLTPKGTHRRGDPEGIATNTFASTKHRAGRPP